MVEIVEALNGRKRKAKDEHEDAPPAKRRRLEAVTDVPAEPPIYRLPPQVLERVAQSLHSNDPIATKNDQKNFQATCRTFRNVAAGAPIPGGGGAVDGGSPALKKFNRRLKRLGILAVDAIQDVLPAGGLPNHASLGDTRDGRRNQPIAAHDIVDTIGAVLIFQEDKEPVRKLVASMQELYAANSEAAIEVLQSLVTHSDGLSDVHRMRLGNTAVHMLGRYHRFSREQSEAAEVLLQLKDKGHLHWRSQERLQTEIDRHPDLKEVLDDAQQVMEGEQQRPRVEELRVLEDRECLDNQITNLEETVRASRRIPGRSDHERLDGNQPVGREVGVLYNTARLELALSLNKDDRKRDGRGR